MFSFLYCSVLKHLTWPLHSEHFPSATALPEQFGKLCKNMTNKKIAKETISREDNAYVSIYEVLQKAVSVELLAKNSSISSFNASSRLWATGKEESLGWNLAQLYFPLQWGIKLANLGLFSWGHEYFNRNFQLKKFLALCIYAYWVITKC